MWPIRSTARRFSFYNYADGCIDRPSQARPLLFLMKVASLILLIFSFSLTSLPMLAHHSFSAEFDDSKPVKVTGVVTRVEWQNPHIWFYVDVKDDNGNVTHWAFSGGPPGMLIRRGIRKDV